MANRQIGYTLILSFPLVHNCCNTQTPAGEIDNDAAQKIIHSCKQASPLAVEEQMFVLERH